MNERITLSKSSQPLEHEEVVKLAYETIAPLTNAAWIIGYTSGERRKFAIPLARTVLERDAIQILEPLIAEWFGEENEETE